MFVDHKYKVFIMSLFYLKQIKIKEIQTLFNGLNAKPMQNPTIGGPMVLELCHLRTHFRTYKQFISCFCNVFLIGKFVILYGTAPRSQMPGKT